MAGNHKESQEIAIKTAIFNPRSDIVNLNKKELLANFFVKKIVPLLSHLSIGIRTIRLNIMDRADNKSPEPPLLGFLFIPLSILKKFFLPTFCFSC